MISKRPTQIFILLLFIGFLTFANGLKNPMMLDDHTFFDEKMRNIKFLWMQFVPDKNIFLGLKDQKVDVYYRPLAHVIPMLAYAAFHNNVVGHHVLNLILLILASFMITVFVFTLWRDWRLGFLAGAGYLVHPINGIMVNYITASVFSAQVIFMLMSLLCWLEYQVRSKKREVRGGHPIASYFLLLASYSCFVFALMCHETAMTLPFYATALIYILNNTRDGERGTRDENVSRPFFSSIVHRLSSIVPAVLPYWLMLIGYFLLRLKFSSLSSSILNNYEKFHMNVFEYGASMAHLAVWYLGKLFYPVGIVIIKPIDVQRSYVILWLIVAVMLAAAAVYLMWRYRRRPSALLGIVWLCVGFIPFTQACLFLPIHGPVLEPHWFAFPVIGFFIFLSSIVSDLWDRMKRRIILVGTTMVLLFWIVCSWGMNVIWGNEIGYYYYWLRQAPGYTAVMFYLAQAYEIRHHHAQARVWYEEALARNYKPDMTLSNLALVDIMEKRWDLARQHLQQALEYNPNIVSAYVNLGNMAAMQGQDELARKHFRKAIDIDRYSMLPRINLAKIMIKAGDTKAAIKEYEDVLDIVPDNETALTDVLLLYWKGQQGDQVLSVGKKLLAVSKNAVTLTNIGLMAESLGRRELAVLAYQKAVASDARYIKAKRLLERLE